MGPCRPRGNPHRPPRKSGPSRLRSSFIPAREPLAAIDRSVFLGRIADAGEVDGDSRPDRDLCRRGDAGPGEARRPGDQAAEKRVGNALKAAQGSINASDFSAAFKHAEAALIEAERSLPPSSIVRTEAAMWVKELRAARAIRAGDLPGAISEIDSSVALGRTSRRAMRRGSGSCSPRPSCCCPGTTRPPRSRGTRRRRTRSRGPGRRGTRTPASSPRSWPPSSGSIAGTPIRRPSIG